MQDGKVLAVLKAVSFKGMHYWIVSHFPFRKQKPTPYVLHDNLNFSHTGTC